MYNIRSILEFMDKVTDVVKTASPLATALGIPFVEKIAGLADTAVEIGKNALDRKDDVEVILTAKDEASINERIEKLDALNAELNDYIVNS